MLWSLGNRPRRNRGTKFRRALPPSEPRALLVELLERRRMLSVDAQHASGTSSAENAQTSELAAAYLQAPLSFEPNVGQTDGEVNFLARGEGYSLYLTPTQAVLDLTQSASEAAGKPSQLGSATLGMQLVGANDEAQATGLDLLPSKSNYVLGNDISKWRTNVANYGQVRYSDVWPGISATYYGNQRQLEYDFAVAPGADPRAIELSFSGSESISIDGGGNLVLATASGEVVEHAPVVYQQAAAGRDVVSARYEIRADGNVGFAVGAYDARVPLVIDPVLSYATYLGGSNSDVGQSIAVDGSGNVYVTGFTQSANFPTHNPEQTTYAANGDAFVAKFGADGSLVYSTYFGGSGDDAGNGIAVDISGNAYVTGKTSSANFPTANNSYQQANAGGYDAFVAEFASTGSLEYSTYLGGAGDDYGNGIAADGSGNVFATGYTDSANFPIASPHQAALAGGNDAFVAELSSSGSLVHSTYLGGAGDDRGNGIAVDSSGNAFVTGYTLSANFPSSNPLQSANGGGSDAFVTEVGAGGSLVYSTYLGGNAADVGNGIAVDRSGNAYITGVTASANFPTTNGSYQPAFASGGNDAFVAKVSVGGSLAYATYLGGSGDDGGYGITADGSGNAFVTGYTLSTDFPASSDALQPHNGGLSDAFVTRFGSGGSLIYSSYLGGSGLEFGYGVAVDGSRNIYVTGQTSSANLPTNNPYQQTFGGGSNDAFVAKVSLSVTLNYTASAAGSYTLKLKNGTIEVLDSGNNVVAQSPASDTAAIVFTNGSAGAVSLSVDDSGGDPIPSGGLDFVGGGSDTLEVTGYNTTTLTETFTGPHSGSVQLDGGRAISYSGLSPVLFTGGTVSDIVFNLPAGAVQASLEDDGTPGNNIVELVSGNGAFESTTFAAPTNSLTINAGGGTDSITANADFSGDFHAGLSIIGAAATDTVSLNSLNLTAGAGALSVTAKTINLGGNISTAGAQNYVGAVQLGADVALAASGAADISFSSTIDNQTAVAKSLQVSTGGGKEIFGGVVGGGANGGLAGLSTGGGTTQLNAGGVTTTGLQSYGDAVQLGADATLASNGADIHFISTVNAAAAGAESLTVSPGAGNVTFDADLGTAKALSSLTVNGTGATTVAGDVTTTAAQSYQEAVTLGADVTLKASSATFAGALDSDATARALTIDGAATFNGAAGGANPLKSLSVTGTVDINGGQVTTTGAQSYGGAATLSADATLTASTVTFVGAVDSDTTARDLTIHGAAVFDSAAGGTNALESLSVTGAADIEGGAITTVVTQNYAGAVTLSADTALVNPSNLPDAVTFGGTLDSDSAATPRSLTITGGATFVGIVGGVYPLYTLIVDGQSKMEESEAFIVTSTYHNPVTLTADATLHGSVTFEASVDSYSDNAPLSLTIDALPGYDGLATFDAPVGELHALKLLTVNSPAKFTSSPDNATQGGSVKTEQSQTYGGPTTFQGDAALTTTQGGDIDFNDVVSLGASATANISSNGGKVNFLGAVDGTSMLNIDTSGMTTFEADVGATTPPTNVHVTGPTTFGSPITPPMPAEAGIRLGALAQLYGGASVTQLFTNYQGSQRYDGPVLVNANASVNSITNGDVVFGSNVDSPNGSGLAVSTLLGNNAVGVVHFNGPVGENGAIGNLAVVTGGPFALSVKLTTLQNIIVSVLPDVQQSPASLELAAGATLNSAGSNPQGQVKLLAFNSVSIDAGAAVVSNGAAVIVSADFSSNTFNSTGAAINLNGRINAPSISVGGGVGDLLYINDANGVAGSDSQQTLSGYGLAAPLSYTGVRPAVLTPLTLPSIVAGASSYAGESISALLASGPADKKDLPAGIAIVGLSDANAADGAWQFSTDSGATWNALGSPSDNSARLLGSNDRVRFLPAANFAGNMGFVFRAWDEKTGTDGGVSSTGGGAAKGFSSATQTASITVNPAPGTPSFTAGPDQTVLENSGPQTVTGWATNIDPGQIDGQPPPTVNFVVNTDNNAFFSVVPAIDATTGTLTYTPAADVVGIANVTVQLENNGGPAHGGHDSAPQTFTITMKAPVPPGGTYVIGSGTVNVPAEIGILSNSGGTSAYTVKSGNVTGAQGGTFTFQSDGSFAYKPGANGAGYDSVQVAVTSVGGNQSLASVNVLTQHAGVVWKFYESVLGRAPDPAGLQYWTNYFNNGGSTGDMAFGFFESDELLDKVIANYYQQYLLRSLDPSGLSYWVGVWHDTGGPEQIKAGFAGSPEFYKSSGATPDGWIDALYRRILSRAPDPSGKTYWLNFYQQNTAAGDDPGKVRFQIALGFFDSAESYGQDVAGWFQQYLLRLPSGGEQSQYKDQMLAGATDRTIEREIANLPEYAANPAAPPQGTAAALPDYYQSSGSSSASSPAGVAAKDALFSRF